MIPVLVSACPCIPFPGARCCVKLATSSLLSWGKKYSKNNNNKSYCWQNTAIMLSPLKRCGSQLSVGIICMKWVWDMEHAKLLCDLQLQRPHRAAVLDVTFTVRLVHDY